MGCGADGYEEGEGGMVEEGGRGVAVEDGGFASELRGCQLQIGDEK